MRVVTAAVILLSLVTSTVVRADQRRPAKRVAATTPARSTAASKRDRSIGAPWSGRLQGSARLDAGDGYHLRRPWRTFATRTTVELVRRAIETTREQHPEAHILAIGDLSAKTGGRISEHASHQSGRDVDLGLLYKAKPREYPARFVRATAETLDVEATWRLLWTLARTEPEDGGVQMMFLDYDLQRVLYAHAKKRGLSQRGLDKTFQYPRGRTASSGLVRHLAHHDDHLHVRFKCRARDRDCR